MKTHNINFLYNFFRKLVFRGTQLSVILRGIAIFLLWTSMLKESPSENTLIFILVLLCLFYTWFLIINTPLTDGRTGFHIFSFIVFIILLGAIFDPTQIIVLFSKDSNSMTSLKVILIIIIFSSIFYFRDYEFYTEFLEIDYSDNSDEKIIELMLRILYGSKYLNYFELEKNYRVIAYRLKNEKNISQAFYAQVISDCFEIMNKAEEQLLYHNTVLHRIMEDRIFSVRGYAYDRQYSKQNWECWEKDENFMEMYEDVMKKLKTL